VASEEHDRQVKAGEKALAETEAAAKAAKKQIEAEREVTTAQQTALRADRDAAAAAVPAKLYERYRVYAPRHHGVAVATVDGEACSGCRVHLRPYVVQRIGRPEYSELEECESCGRMLYYEPPPAPPAAQTPAHVAQAAGSPEPARE